LKRKGIDQSSNDLYDHHTSFEPVTVTTSTYASSFRKYGALTSRDVLVPEASRLTPSPGRRGRRLASKYAADDKSASDGSFLEEPRIREHESAAVPGLATRPSRSSAASEKQQVGEVVGPAIDEHDAASRSLSLEDLMDKHKALNVGSATDAQSQRVRPVDRTWQNLAKDEAIFRTYRAPGYREITSLEMANEVDHSAPRQWTLQEFFSTGPGRRPRSLGGSAYTDLTQGTLTSPRPRAFTTLAYRHSLLPTRCLHTSARFSRAVEAVPTAALEQQPYFKMSRSLPKHSKDSPIRAQLLEWEALYGKQKDPTDILLEQHDAPESGDMPNSLTRLPMNATALFHQTELSEEEEREAMTQFTSDSAKDPEGIGAADIRWLKAGDLVELEFNKEEREGIVAVVVRNMGYECQVFTMTGRWEHVPANQLQYSIAGWAGQDLLDPILPYLPDPRSPQERETLNEQAYIDDLSVPREVAARLVRKMTQFHNESQEIYRKHAGSLDRAHEILAHQSDLRYGSLVSAAVTLLKARPDDLPLTALYTVRKALKRAGFAFGFDKRSHRMTGYLQIRSREQVRTVEAVRDWIRDWQDDLALQAALADDTPDRKRPRKHKTSATAQYVYDFIDKAKQIVLNSRQTRDCSPHGNIGPSKIKIPITSEQDSVKVILDTQFTREDIEIVKFIEAWCCSRTLIGLPRLQALPPLILHALGLYTDLDLRIETGFVFLQELGTVLPYENRIRFDQHLLLPSSQHSLPLQKLMQSLVHMKDNHNLTDSMHHLRHDWKDLPVYCIDDAGAHEIDDGISIEPAGTDQWWVHTHIANPTAFFDRDHALAKMARHMGESIYMPERSYMMLPRWASSTLFSLAPDRPCLTFSARLNEQGETLEIKARSCIVRNVMRLTPKEIRSVLGVNENAVPEIVMTVGGELPTVKQKRSGLTSLDETRKEQLKVLSRLAEKRGAIRQAAGGLFFHNDRPNIEIWQNNRSAGLTWDNPYRKGSRIVQGDPIIQMRVRPSTNWFEANADAGQILVREMMMLASETAARWCAERQIPALFRGIQKNPHSIDSETYRREVIVPAAEGGFGGFDTMHLGLNYVNSLGTNALSSRPLKHDIMGLDYYSKVTSPLRRYGDMIQHWQIEAALREEAETGHSLVTDNERADRSFLPFSTAAINTIALGLQPRERMVTGAKANSLDFWAAQLLFRVFHFGENPHILPFWTEASPTWPDTGAPKPLARVFIATAQHISPWTINVLNIDMDLPSQLFRPSFGEKGLEEPKQGDIWECHLRSVNPYVRQVLFEPVRLARRAAVEGLEIKGMSSAKPVLAEVKARATAQL